MPDDGMKGSPNKLGQGGAEGENHRPVFLTVYMKVIMDDVRTMIVLSASGAGLALVLNSFASAGWWSPLVIAGAVVAFSLSLIRNFVIWQGNADYLFHSHRSEMACYLDPEIFKKSSKMLFAFGCLLLIMQGVGSTGLITGGNRFSTVGKDLPTMQQKEREAMGDGAWEASDAKDAHSEDADKQMVSSFRQGGEDEGKNAISPSAKKIPGLSAGAVKAVAETPKDSSKKPSGSMGNGGNFRSGRAL